MNYADMKRSYMQGWHTWNVRSVLSHVYMPDGFALNIAFKEYREGHYLKETLVGRFVNEYGREPAETAFPGPHAFDGSYTEMTVKWCDMEIRVESACEGNDLTLLITPVKKQIRPAMLVLEGGFLWGRPGWVEQNGQMLIGHTGSCDRTVYAVGTPMYDPNIPVQAACLCLVLDGPVAITTGTCRTLEEAQANIAARREDHARKCARFGDLGGMYEALESALGWDTVYDAKNDRVISPVSRLWSIGSGGYVLFCWDNFFAGFMASLGCRELAYSNLREILNEQTAAGFVPNLAYATGQVSADRSQPPVGSAMLLETYRVFREKWIVEEMYDGLLRWNQWFAGHRMNPDGALCWGSEEIPVLYGNRWESEGVHDTYGAALESGLDNSPMYDDVPFNKETNRLELEDVGLTGLYILDCRSLMELARLIGREADLPWLQTQMDKARAGLETLWDEANGFYYNRRTDTGKFSRRISPTNFYALFSPDVTPERQRRIADEHYFNPEEFYGEWMLPSIARNDAAYRDQNYWRGRVWAPLNFLTYLALARTDLIDVRRDLARKSTALFMKEWTEHRHVHENYSAITGEGCDSGNSDKFYHWGALLCVIALAEAGHIPGLGLPLPKEQ
ncbi:MAG: hypothetical protein E7316_01500 [Clostridiales bacterium]|nr:hypothetical protein [Clostridiales bacterium]